MLLCASGIPPDMPDHMEQTGFRRNLDPKGLCKFREPALHLD